MKIYRKLTTKKIITIAFFAIIISICVYFFSTKFFEKNAYDTLIKLTANKSGLENIVHVVIDDESIKKVGNWPWRRTLYTDMFEFLEIYGEAKAIGFDAVLSAQGNKIDDKEFLNRLKGLNKISVGIDFNKNINEKNSQETLNFFASKFSIKVNDLRTPSFIKNTSYNSYRETLPGYLEEINSAASVNTALDTDGTVRAFEPIVTLQGKYYPSLPLAIYMSIYEVKEINLYNNKYDIVHATGEIKTFPLKQTKEKSVQYIKWLAPYDNSSWVPHKQFKASDVIESYKKVRNGDVPTIDPNEFKNKIIIIGATANALYDLKITPMTVNFPGNAIQATAIDNLLTGNNITIANWYTNLAVMFIFVILITLLIMYFSPFISFMGILILFFLHFYLLLFTYSKGIALNVVTPYIFFLLVAILAYSYRFSVEDYKKEKLKRAMKKYISTNVVDDIIQNSDEVKLGGKKTELTILMADIRGFTKISENLDPNEVTSLLNEFFEIMLPVIEKYNGSVNKFIGDAILAVFNEPIKDRKHPINAILCATEMLTKLQELRKKWKAEGKPDIGISIGINTGMAFIGNIGTPNHLEYTVIGDTVNVASRIEAQNRQFNTQLLISESTYEYAKDMLDVIKISSVEIRGREKHIDIYEIINILKQDEINR